MEENNGLRAPPGLTYRQNVSGGKPETSLSNILPEAQMSDPNPPFPRRQSEATTHAGADPKLHLRKGGGNWKRYLRQISIVLSLEVEIGYEGGCENWNVYFTDVQSKTDIRRWGSRN